jgi:hypothetical protein
VAGSTIGPESPARDGRHPVERRERACRHHYAPVATTRTFAVGQTVRAPTVPVFHDTRADGPRLFTVRLVRPTGGAALRSPDTAA